MPTTLFSSSLVQPAGQLISFISFNSRVCWKTEIFFIHRKKWVEVHFQPVFPTRGWHCSAHVGKQRKPHSSILASLVLTPCVSSKLRELQQGLRVAGTSGNHLVPPPAHSGLSWSGLLRATFHGILSICKRGHSTASLGSQFEHLTTSHR